MKTVNQAIILSAALTFSALFLPAQAAQSTVKITSEVHELIEVLDEQGKPQQKIIAADEITPGDHILFTTRFINQGDKASDNVMITNPIPKHTRYLEGSAKGEHFTITFSVDGNVWADAKTLKIRQKDGKYRAATAADYTHIRWKYNRALKPSEKKSISFETTLL